MIVSHPSLIFAPRSGKFAQCHAPTIAKIPDGRTFVAWFAGTAEKYPDTAIWMRVMEGGRWGDLSVVAKVADVAHWNPVLFLDPKNVLRLYFKVGAEIDTWETWETELDMSSSKWGEPRKMCKDDPSFGRGPVKNKIVVLKNGDWLAPASTEKCFGHKIIGFYRIPKSEWNAFVDISKDGGKTWSRSPQVPFDREKYGMDSGIIQPALWEYDGVVHMLLRSTEGCLFRSWSLDKGETWTIAEPTDIPNPNSSADIAQFDDGRLALIYNPHKNRFGGRASIAVSFSKGAGEEWSAPGVIEKREGGNFSYPFSFVSGNELSVVYSWNRLSIAHFEMKM